MATEMVTVDGTLTNDAGKTFPVQLQLTVKTLPQSDDRAVARCALLTGEIRDGKYTLQYFYQRPYEERVRVQMGMILAP